MNKDVYVNGIRVYSDIFAPMQIECMAQALAKPLRVLSPSEMPSLTLIHDIAREFEVLNGQRPGCVTLFDGVAIAWHYDPHTNF